MRVLIVGGGAIGLATALRLSQGGAEVQVVEATQVADSTSTRNAGWIVPSMATPFASPSVVLPALRWMVRPDSPFYLSPELTPSFMSFMTSMLRHCTSARYEIGIARLAQIASSAVLDHRELATQAAGTGFRTTSITSLHKTAKDLDHHLVDYRHMREHLGELTWTVVDRDEMAAGGTNVADGIVGGIRVEHQATVDAPAFVAALEEACIAGGVELTSNTPVHLQSSRGTVVARTLTGDQIRADRFVVAAGAATNEVVRGLGERLPLVAGKGYGFDLKNLSACSEPVYLSEAKVALTPYQDGRLRVAGTMGINSSDGRVSVRRANGILSALGEYLPELHDVPYPKPWTGVRSLTPDGLPLIGPLRRWPTVVVAAGHAMLGITLAPATARIVAELLERPTNHPALAPGRFRTHPY